MTGLTPANEDQRRALLALPGSHEDSSGTVFVTVSSLGRALAIVEPVVTTTGRTWRDHRSRIYRSNNPPPIKP